MRCDVISIFPDMFKAISEYGVIGRAISSNLLELNLWDLRKFSDCKYNNIDDKAYGGGPGMVMQYQPLQAALNKVKDVRGDSSSKSKVIYLSPQGERLAHKKLISFYESGFEPIFVSGRYEGIDERFIENSVDEQWSLGDYVLSGGELAIMVALDAIARFIPGVLGNEESNKQDSFYDGLLDHPHYTKPQYIEGMSVPKILLSGDHSKIARWRLKQRLGRTKLYRPDLLENIVLTKEQRELLEEFMQESGDINE